MNSIVLLLVLVVLLVIILVLYLFERKDARQLLQQVNQLASKLQSQSVKHGQQWEHFVPFMDNYPGDREHSVYLGMPIDYLSFGNDQILFIEVKTGNSGLSEKQKQIKQLIEEKKVGWREVQYH